MLAAGGLAASSMRSGPFRPASQEATTIELVEAYGPPGANITMPVDLRAAPGVQVGRIDLEFAVPRAVVTFARAVLSDLSRSLGVQLTADAKPDEHGRMSIVRVTLTTPEAESKRAIANGQVAYLSFRLAETAKPGTVISIKPTVTVRPLDSAETILQPIDVPNSEIMVSSPAAASCFFYMH